MALRERTLAMEHLLDGVAEQLPRAPAARASSATTTCARRRTKRRAAASSELAQLIERMGSVNLDAMREHDEAEKRFTFYTTQKADLDKALADLDARHPADEPRVAAASSRRRSRR